ncbi:hypothetical protein KZZ52_13025 [Dactylosporangium sp. AC04546]|uniref:hypothetical protein n=1 Tax=Dactylosporangium sp. AC04546 TaxID=2862460 RepID=UPI001EDE3BD3|nr:hypothetical protein [Dactylosporangium sp. AC04546]WVK86259.1 hypothetical protein KZZ52_13025 [Dactylosporangium sp. AC04546]
MDINVVLEESRLQRLGLFVSGIEVTQAVQFFDAERHLTDPADRQGDNALRLVSGKPAWVRVYVASVFGASGLTAELTVQRRRLGFLYTPVATLSPHASSATSVPPSFGTTYAGTRGTIGETVNFVVPAGEMIGHLRLVARVRSGARTAEATIDVEVTLRQTLRLAGVLISYNGPSGMQQGAPNLTLPAPALADLQAMAGTALTLFPVESTAAFRVAGTLTQTVPLQSATFPPSGCGAAWDALHARVATVRTADGNQPGWIYYGLLPSGTPMGPVVGCGGGGVAVGPIGDPWTLAHEAGHAAGLAHAPSGGAPNPDPNFPPYEPYDPAGVAQGHDGEYGLDVNTGNVLSPQTFQDVMGYAWPKWISPYHHGRLINAAVLSPVTVGMDHPWWRDLVWQEIKIPPVGPPPVELPVHPQVELRHVVSVLVLIEDGRVGDVVKVARTRAHPELPAAGATPFTANLRDAEGRVLASGVFVRLTTAACGCAGLPGRPPSSYVAQAFLPDVAPGATLDITTRGETVWRREAPGEPPRVALAEPKVSRSGAVTVAWEATAGAAEYWLRWSRDGESWESVDVDLTGRELELEPGRVPSGEGFLQVVAHDGFHSAVSDPVRIRVPDLVPQVAILHPRDGYTYLAGQELRLWASVIGTASDAVWTVDGAEAGRGLDAWAALEPGEHRITVAVDGAEATVTVTAERLD